MKCFINVILFFKLSDQTFVKDGFGSVISTIPYFIIDIHCKEMKLIFVFPLFFKVPCFC